MLEIDRYAIALRAPAAGRDGRRILRALRVPPGVARLQTFCSEDLGAFYLDILKDRLYTTAADARPRRSAQTALWHVTASRCCGSWRRS